MTDSIALNLNTLLKVLAANNAEHFVSRSIMIDTNSLPIAPDFLIVDVYKDNLPKGKKFQGDKSYGGVSCQVVMVNPYKIDSNHLVLLPDESTKWVSVNKSSERQTITVIEDITL